MNDGPQKFHTGYLVEGLELLICNVGYTKYDATGLVRWFNYKQDCAWWGPQYSLDESAFQYEGLRAGINVIRTNPALFQHRKYEYAFHVFLATRKSIKE
jgi:hypothetical protein